MSEDYTSGMDGHATDNPEALLLAALLITRNEDELHRQVDRLHVADFYETNYAAVFATMKDQLAQHRPCDAASIRSALRAQGENSGIPLGDVDSLIQMLTTLDVNPFILDSYAQQVASASYRRQFAAMTATLARLADTAAEDELYTLFVEEGHKQRQARARYETFLGDNQDNKDKPNN